MSGIFKKLRIPNNAKYGLDDAATTEQRRNIILNKGFLRKLYKDWYKSVIEKLSNLPEGKIVEIGSGAGFIKEIAPNILTSDILPLKHCDLVLTAEELPFADGELSAILMIDVLHHIPDCSRFFKEAQRVLKKGGKIVMLEPANTACSRLIYKNLHNEPFDAKTKSWSFPSTGPLSGANIALPWIVFTRDLEVFKTQFPSLQLVSINYHTPFRYLLSGGVTYYPVVPAWSFGFFTFLEKMLSPLSKICSMFQTIEVVKNAN